MKRPPERFDKATYVAWHNDAHPEDRDLGQRVGTFCDGLRLRTGPQIRLLGQVLTQIAEHTEREVRVDTGDLLPLRFKLPTEQIIGKTKVRARVKPQKLVEVPPGPRLLEVSPGAPRVRLFSSTSSTAAADAPRSPDPELFKPTDSILEKMWRLNRRRSGDEADVCLDTLTTEVHDLIRTSVVAPTLLHAREYIKRLRRWKDFVKSEEIPYTAPLSALRDISVDSEAKLARGYFAFHALARFDPDVCIEVQVFSDLTSAWRSISHRLYERARIGAEVDARPGARDARLASLGHLLHLADCEIERLAREFSAEIED